MIPAARPLSGPRRGESIVFIIADNVTTRNPQIEGLFQRLETTGWDPQQAPAKRLQELVRRCLAAGAGAIEINIQQHHDQPRTMESAIRLIQGVTDCQLCLSTNSAEALEVGLRTCERFPLVNYISLEPPRLSEMLPMAAKYGGEVVLLASDAAAPTDAREMLGKAAVLLGAAVEAGIPRDRVLIDPGVIHITHDVGQRHLVEIREFLSTLPDAFEFPVKTTCWLSNISSGAPQRLREVIESTLLTVLSTMGLSSVFMNVLQPETARAMRLIRMLNNEEVYSDGEVELKPV